MSDKGPADAAGAPEPDPVTPPPKKATAKKAATKKVVAKKTTTAKQAAAAKKTSAKKTAKTAAKATPAKKKATVKKKATKKVAPTTPSATTATRIQDPAGDVAQGLPAAVTHDDVRAAGRDAATEIALPSPDQVDRPWLRSYPPLVPESYPYPDVPFTRLLDDAAKDFPDSVAMNFLGAATNYRRLLDHVDRFAAALLGLGVGPGDRVGIVLPNCPQHVVAVFATLRLGAIVVELDAELDDGELAACVNDAGCRVLVILDPVYAKIERLKGQVSTVEHVVGTALSDYLPALAAAAFNLRHRRDPRLVHKIGSGEGVLRFPDLVRRSPAAAPQQPVQPDDDVALIAYSRAGGDPVARGVALTHRNLLTNVFQIRLWIPDVQAGRETVLCAVPFSHPYGLLAGMGLGVLSAATLALSPSDDRDRLLATIDKRSPTLFPAAASIIEALASAPHLRRHDLSSIRVALCDTSLLSADIAKTFESATGGRVREGLAIDEAGGMTHANPVYGKAKADRVGLPLSDTVCVLVGDDQPSIAAGPGSRGELLVGGPQVMKGYWNRPEETAAALHDGWLRTGYLAEVDDDGYYCVLGRVDGSDHTVSTPLE